MKTNLKLFLATCAVALLTACGNNTSGGANTSSGEALALTGSPLGNAPSATAQMADAYTPSAEKNASNQQSSLFKARDLAVAPVPAEVYLGAPDTNKLSNAQAKSKVEDSSIPLTTGIGRNVAQTSNSALTKQLLTWKNTTTGGNVAAINFNSAGAKGLRIGLLVTKLPETATLRFYAKGATQAIEVKAGEVLSNLALNLAAGDTSDAGRTFWSPRIDGAEGIVEIELPAGVSTDNVDISIPTLSHIFLSSTAITDKFATAYTRPNDGLTCEIDINCSATVPAVSNAVAVIQFIKVDGTSSACTGTLLNDAINSRTPYFSTANHCISTQTVASTAFTVWFYKSASCNSTSGNYYLGTTSATLLFTVLNTDGTLLRLNQAPPVGVMYAGWDAATPPTLGSAVAGIHHPQIDSQRISSGNILSYLALATRSATGYTTSPSDITNSTIVRTSLLTESGSSGSALFKNITGTNPQVIGQLLGGPAAVCGGAHYADYGRFDKSFNAGMKAFLSPAAPATNPNRQPVYRFYNAQSNVYFYTISSVERDTILATLSNALTYEGIAFYASPTAAAGYSTIYRFRNTVNGSYLYTISEVEKNSILQGYPQYVLEGTAWFAEPSAAGGGSPLYRFRTNNNTHIYTAYESERASIIANYPSFVFEGPAYYVKLTP